MGFRRLPCRRPSRAARGHQLTSFAGPRPLTPPARPCSPNEDEAPWISERLVETPDYLDDISISYRDCAEWLDDENRSRDDDSSQEISDVDQDRPGTAGSSEMNVDSVDAKTQADYETMHACILRYFWDLAQ